MHVSDYAAAPQYIKKNLKSALDNLGKSYDNFELYVLNLTKDYTSEIQTIVNN